MRVQVTVTDDARLGEILPQQSQDLVQRHHLFGRAVVFVLVFGRMAMSPFITHADRVGVPALHMAAFDRHEARVVDAAVPADIDVTARPGAEAVPLWSRLCYATL